MRSSLVVATATVAFFAGALRAQAGLATCYEPAFGTLLGSADDTVFPAIQLNVPFPAFGAFHTHVEVSSNGFVWLGANNNPDSGCCSGTGTALAAGAARICALWTDLVTDGVDGSGVYHASLPARDVITWYRAFESYDPSVRFTIQMQLTAAGDVTVWYHPATAIAQPPHTGVCGVSPGGLANPGSLDFSASFPHDSGTQPTVYEEWSLGTSDLAQRTFEFVPNGFGGWLLQDRPACPFAAGAWQPFGAGCPLQSGISGASFYETFTGSTLDLANQQFELLPLGNAGYFVLPTANAYFTGYTNFVPMGDDLVVDQTLPFPFTHPGGVCTIAGFCSNGFVWLDNFNNNAPAAPYVPGFLFDGPRIAALWTDLDLTAGGGAYFDTTATAAHFTWLDAPDFTNPSLRSTFQVQLHNDGRIILCWQSLAVGPNRPVLAGYGLGGQTWDPGPIDLTANVPFSSGTGVLPVTLDWTGAPPVLGQNFPLQVGQLRPSAVAGLLVLGLTAFNPGLPLAAIGMPNCSAYASLDVTLGFATTAPMTPLTIALPADAAFLGASLHTQAAVLDPGLTPFGLATSNGGTMLLGFY